MTLPSTITRTQLSDALEQAGLKINRRDETHDFYIINSDLQLVVTTDRITSLGFILPTTVFGKGKIITAITIFWLTKVITNVKHGLIAFGKNIDEYIPHRLHCYPELQSRAVISRREETTPEECAVYGYKLKSGRALLKPVAVNENKELAALSLSIYQQAADFALKKGIVLANTKLRFSNNNAVTGEVITPDSSLFWTKNEWSRAIAEKTLPSPLDKNVLKNWNREKLKNLDPANLQHVFSVSKLRIPSDLPERLTTAYRKIFRRLAGENIENFQRDTMNIA